MLQIRPCQARKVHPHLHYSGRKSRPPFPIRKSLPDKGNPASEQCRNPTGRKHLAAGRCHCEEYPYDQRSPEGKAPENRGHKKQETIKNRPNPPPLPDYVIRHGAGLDQCLFFPRRCPSGHPHLRLEMRIRPLFRKLPNHHLQAASFPFSGINMPAIKYAINRQQCYHNGDKKRSIHNCFPPFLLIITSPALMAPNRTTT